MNAKKCDICGVYFDEYKTIPKYRIEENYGHGSFYLDLCPSCNKKLSAIVENGAKSKEETS